MTPYKHYNGNSGIKAYEILDKGILLQFQDDSIYKYTYKSNGKIAVEIMKGLAQKGIGLATFINKQVKNKFAEKLQ